MCGRFVFGRDDVPDDVPFLMYHAPTTIETTRPPVEGDWTVEVRRRRCKYVSGKDIQEVLVYYGLDLVEAYSRHVAPMGMEGDN